MNKPHIAPNSSERAVQRHRKTGMPRIYFLYVIATILVTAFLLDWLRLPSPHGIGTLFIATGPFTLYFHYQWMGAPQDGIIFGVATASATSLYLAIPNRGTLAVSIVGGVVWALSGYFWIAMLA